MRQLTGFRVGRIVEDGRARRLTAVETKGKRGSETASPSGSRARARRHSLRRRARNERPTGGCPPPRRVHRRGQCARARRPDGQARRSPGHAARRLAHARGGALARRAATSPTTCGRSCAKTTRRCPGRIRESTPATRSRHRRSASTTSRPGTDEPARGRRLLSRLARPTARSPTSREPSATTAPACPTSAASSSRSAPGAKAVQLVHRVPTATSSWAGPASPSSATANTKARRSTWSRSTAPGRCASSRRDSGLVAISPDGRRAFVEQGPAQGRPNVRVLDVASAQVVARLDLTTRRSVASAWSTTPGTGEGTVSSRPPASGLAVFRVRANDPSRSSRRSASKAPGSPSRASQPAAEPRDRAGRASSVRRRVLFDCDRATGRCARFSRCRSPRRPRVPRVAPQPLQPQPPAGRRDSHAHRRAGGSARPQLACAARHEPPTVGGHSSASRTSTRLCRGNGRIRRARRIQPQLARGLGDVHRTSARRAEGWLPAGWYSQWGHWNQYDGSAVRGRVWWLQDKYCRDGDDQAHRALHPQ